MAFAAFRVEALKARLCDREITALLTRDGVRNVCACISWFCHAGARKSRRSDACAVLDAECRLRCDAARREVADNA